MKLLIQVNMFIQFLIQLTGCPWRFPVIRDTIFSCLTQYWSWEILLILTQIGMCLTISHFYFNFDFFIKVRLRCFFISLLFFFACPFSIFLWVIGHFNWEVVCYTKPLSFFCKMNVFPSFEYNVCGYLKVFHCPLINSILFSMVGFWILWQD